MTLTGFLLARIAEDEAAAHVATTSHGGAYAEHIARQDPARTLDRCRAYRRTVEDFEVLHRDYRETHDPTTEARRFQARIAMAHLAAIYSDHPDYREEWRP